MNFSLQLRIWAVNVFLLLGGFYVVLGFFTIVNFLNVEYPPFPHSLVFLSPLFDQALLFVLSSLMLILPLILDAWKRASWLMLLSYFFLVFRLFLYFFGSPALGEVFLVFAGFCGLTAIFVGSPGSLNLSRETAITRFLISICCILLAVEFLSAICLFLYPFFPFLSSYHSVWRFFDLETQLFFIYTGLAPILIVIALFFWVSRPLMQCLKSLRRIPTQIQQKLTKFKATLNSALESDNTVRKFKTRYSILMLTFSVILAFFYALYPYFPSINPDGSSVGADIPAYVRMLEGMEESSEGVLSYVFIGHRDRPLSLLLVYGLSKVTGFSPYDAAKFTPLLLAPLLVLSAYLFVRQVGKDLMIPSLAALFTASSHQVTLGLQAGSISNWMGLVVMYLSLGLLFKSLRDESWRLWSFATLTTILLLFTHIYTWGMLIGVLGFYIVLLGFRWLRRRGSSFEFKTVTAMVLVNILVDVVKNLVLGSIGVGREIVGVAQRELALQSLTQFWQSLGFILNYWIGNFCANSLIFYLAIIGVFVILFRDKPICRYLIFLLAVSSFPFVLADPLIKVRLLYNLPVQVFACFGAAFLLKLASNRLKSREGTFLQVFLLLLIVLVSVNCGLRCVFGISNLS